MAAYWLVLGWIRRTQYRYPYWMFCHLSALFSITIHTRILQVVRWEEGSLLVSMSNHRSPVHALMYEEAVTFLRWIYDFALIARFNPYQFIAGGNEQAGGPPAFYTALSVGDEHIKVIYIH